jgi:hypothetical protein
MHHRVISVNGALDTTVPISGPRQGKEALGKLGYDFELRDFDTGTHHTDYTGEYPSIARRFLERRRDQFPRQIIKVFREVRHARDHWVQVTEMTKGTKTRTLSCQNADRKVIEERQVLLEPARLDAEIRTGNKVMLKESGGIKEVIVRVSPRLLDMDAKIAVYVNGRSKLSLTVKPSVRVLLETARAHRDRSYCWWGEIRVTI